MIIEAAPLRAGDGKELRKLHDTVQQHLRALKAMDHELSRAFLTSVLELKLDSSTMFEWQKHTQEDTDVPKCQDLLHFLDIRAQASETSFRQGKKRSDFGKRSGGLPGHITSLAAQFESNCTVCSKEKHPLYACPSFKGMSSEDRMSTVKSKKLCMNCLSGGHFLRSCKSVHRCKKCQGPHHSLLHIEQKPQHTNSDSTTQNKNTPQTHSGHTRQASTISAVENASHFTSLKSSALLMTCKVLVTAPDGCSVEARALLDSGSTACFVSERLAQSLRLPRSNQDMTVTGIAGIQYKTPIQAITKFEISPITQPEEKIDIPAIIVPRVTCDLPLCPVPLSLSWTHLADLPLADPGFGRPGKVDILLGIDVFSDVLLHGRRAWPHWNAYGI